MVCLPQACLELHAKRSRLVERKLQTRSADLQCGRFGGDR